MPGLVVSATKVSNDLKKYLPRNSIFKDCLELDVHDMTSLILSIFIDFTQDVPRSHLIVFRILKPYNSGTKKDIKKQ